MYWCTQPSMQRWFKQKLLMNQKTINVKTYKVNPACRYLWQHNLKYRSPKCTILTRNIPSTFETWWTTTIFVFFERTSFNLSISGISSWFKFTNFKTAPTFWATNCHGTIALWCSATVSTICNNTQKWRFYMNSYWR